MKPKVWAERSLYPDELARLKEHAEVITNGTMEDLRGAEVAIIGGAKVDGAFMDKAGPQLKMVIRHGIGYNNVDVAAASERGILSANTPDGPTESTAEHAVALMLAMTKRVVKADRMLRQNQPWTREDLLGLEALNHVLGVVGYGRIGRRVTEICALGLKMKVLVYDPFVPETTKLPAGASMIKSLDELLKTADVVTVHTPLMPETHHMIGERELRLMKPDAYLVNASRGPVVDEAALIRVLKDGHLAGAGLDVFDVEPPKADNPLLQMDNVVATPHTASNTPQGSQRMSQGVVDQILQLFAGEKPASLLDPAAWPGRAGKKK
ncbi:MAG: hydroxyacid dehydrogenase [Spirochaetales bacterium]|nr:hydroxyacid dehydrogenase [Spirochaetales bacterium]